MKIITIAGKSKAINGKKVNYRYGELLQNEFQLKKNDYGN